MDASWRALPGFVRRELRGGLKGFRIFVACLALGVGTIATVGSVTSAVVGGLARDARMLLGGDIAIRLFYRDLNPEERAYIERSADYAMVNDEGKPAGWRGYLGVGNVSYGSSPGASTIEVVATLAELRERIPPQLYDMVAPAAEQPPVEDLDV